MKLLKLTSESVSSLMAGVTVNFDSVKSKYIDRTGDIFDMEKDGLKFVEGDLTIDNISLIEDKNADFENAKRIFTSLGDKLTPEDADDERLWIYLTHFTFLNYTRIRWADSEKSSKTIIDRYFYKGNGRVTRTRNSIARLWWIPYLTFNSEGATEEEKWKYTRAAFSSQEVFVSLFERTLGSYSNVRKTFLDFVIEKNPQSTAVQFLARKLNNLGGVYLLPYLEEDRLMEFMLKEYNFFTGEEKV